MRSTNLVLTGAFVLFTAAAGAAQEGAAPPPPKMPAWDANLSLGLFSNASRDEGEAPFDGFSQHAEARFDLGRYWTPHLKTELGISVPNRWHSYEYEAFPVPGLPGGGYAFTDKSLRLTVLTPTFTYQFLENAFAHPYVSTGLRVGLVETHWSREAETHTQNRISYAVPPVDRKASTWTARPLVAAGCKSYFNPRMFLRTEGLAAFGADGLAQVTLRVGFGFDF